MTRAKSPGSKKTEEKQFEKERHTMRINIAQTAHNKKEEKIQRRDVPECELSYL